MLCGNKNIVLYMYYNILIYLDEPFAEKLVKRMLVKT
jgi:hypothetical protein